jgi:hypothetical protein
MRPAHYKGVHASSVGTGIANAIFAVGNDPNSPESWVRFCIRAAAEAYEAVIENPPVYVSDRMPGPAELMLGKWAAEGKIGKREPPALLTGKPLIAAAHAAAAVAFQCCMPKVTGRRQTQAYIACIAVGVQRQYIAGKDAKSLLYTAQLALQAHPLRTKTPRQPRRTAGFTA